MRQGFHNPDIINDSNNLYINFGFDFTSEHEWGISVIQQKFDCLHEDINGAKRYLVKRVDEIKLVSVSFFRDKVKYKKTVLYTEQLYDNSKEWIKKFIKNNCYGSGTLSMWDQSDFLFAVDSGTKDEKNLKFIYEAIKNKDALIFLSG